MLKIEEFVDILEGLAPLSLSQKMIEKGSYDNSGVIVKNSSNVQNVLFSLDLSLLAVERALEYGCDTVVTHHPAIYSPIKTLDYEGDTAAVLSAVKNRLNVISFHLNLDVAEGGIDASTAIALGGEKAKIIEELGQNVGYGREFSCPCEISDLISKIKANLGTDKIVCYGSGKVKTVATFCGGGSSSALEYVCGGGVADTIITSDVPHHVIKELTEREKKTIIIPHYAAEDYGFNKFYERIKGLTEGRIRVYYFEDKRFK